MRLPLVLAVVLAGCGQACGPTPVFDAGEAAPPPFVPQPVDGGRGWTLPDGGVTCLVLACNDGTYTYGFDACCGAACPVADAGFGGGFGDAAWWRADKLLCIYTHGN